MPWKVIEYQDPVGDILVRRVPPDGTAELVSGSTLIVQDGQIAAFFHDGRPTDGFRAGRYALSTQNLPVLGKLLGAATMSRSPFRSYVYFVALKTFTDLGWGTPSPILFRDTEFKMVNLRAHGTFAIRVANPKGFLHTIVGTQRMETTQAIQEYLRKIIVSRFAQIVPEVLTTVVDLPQHYDAVAGKVKKAVHDDFDQYGLELVDLLVEAITLPPEVQDAINRAAGSRALDTGELDRYERLARADALRDAAKQPGGGAAAGMGTGLGLGAGLGIARDMLRPTDPGAPGPREPAPRAALTAEQFKEKLRGLKELLDEGLITQEDFEAQKKRLLSQL